jgi:hypothetical protein
MKLTRIQLRRLIQEAVKTIDSDVIKKVEDKIDSEGGAMGFEDIVSMVNTGQEDDKKFKEDELKDFLEDEIEDFKVHKLGDAYTDRPEDE